MDSEGRKIVDMDEDNLYDNDGNIITRPVDNRFVFDQELFRNTDDLPDSDSENENNEENVDGSVSNEQFDVEEELSQQIRGKVKC